MILFFFLFYFIILYLGVANLSADVKNMATLQAFTVGRFGDAFPGNFANFGFLRYNLRHTKIHNLLEKGLIGQLIIIVTC